MIRFGTSGWRGVIAEAITVGSVRRAAAAVARYLIASGEARRGVFVGYDTRFLAGRFAREAAQVISAHGLPVILSATAMPTPAVAFAVRSGRRAAGLTMTAGYEAPEYGGLKLTVAGGAPAMRDVTDAVEQLAAGAPEADPAGARPGRRRVRPGTLRTLDLKAAYLRQLGCQVRLTRIRRARLRIACDLRHGAAIGYLVAALAGATRHLEVLHGTPHPEFGGEPPDCGEPHLRALARAVRRGRHHLGLATDGDGARFGIIDQGGAFIPPGPFLALLADYLIRERGMAGGVARSVATTHLLDAVCGEHGRTVRETPVGFKHIGRLLQDGQSFLGCEEGGGVGLAAHLPDKDGLLAGLLAAEIVAVRRRPLKEQIRDLLARIGPLHGRRIDYHVDAAARDRVLHRLQDLPSAFAGRAIRRVDDTDGQRMHFADGAWILIRASATETIVRCYVEGRTAKDLERLTLAARELITKG
jgi:phosphomannomutase